MHSHPFPRKAFTLIELLVVIAILAILSVVVILTLNPAELLRQSRDANRVSDMATLSGAIGLYQTDTGGAGFIGTSTLVYISIADTTSTCANLGLAAGVSFNCSNSTSSRLVNGLGWVPLDFTKISSGAPLGTVPIDPTNTSSSGLYYTYTTTGNQFQLLSLMESQKYKQTIKGPLGNGTDVVGSNQGSAPMGWWPFNEASGTIAYDTSGNANNGSWNGAATGASGYYSPGQIGSWAGVFDGSSTYVNIPNTGLIGDNPSATNIKSISFWAKGMSSTTAFITSDRAANNIGDAQITINASGSLMYTLDSNPNPPYTYTVSSTATASPSTWNYYVVTLSLPPITAQGTYNGNVTLSVNGSYESKTLTYTNGAGIAVAAFTTLNIGRQHNYTYSTGYSAGLVDDVKIYNRQLSAAEIQAIYNAGK